MAEVNMSLSELKDLERQITELKTANELLLSEQKQIVVLHKYFKATVSPKANTILHISGTVPETDWRTGRFISSKNVDGNIHLGRAIQLNYVDVDLQNDPDKTSKEYMNLSEVIQQIHIEEEQLVKLQLEEAFTRARQAEYDASTVNERTAKELLVMKETYQDLEKNLRKDTARQIEVNEENSTKTLQKLSDAYDILKQEFDDLKSDKQRISLEDQIKDLSNQIKHEQSRSAWDRITNTNLYIQKKK